MAFPRLADAMKRVMVKDQWWAPRVLSRNIVEDDDDDD
jgi:hypothetical protein